MEGISLESRSEKGAPILSKLNDWPVQKIESSELMASPYDHLSIDDFLPPEFALSLRNELVDLETELPDDVFTSENGHKIGYRNMRDRFPHYSSVLHLLSDESLTGTIRKKLNTDALYGDKTFDGGGFVISPPGTFLRDHADFNFSNNVKKYRVVNLILYLNYDYRTEYGGQLRLLDSENRTIEKLIEPRFNRAVIFKTHAKTLHGVSKNAEGFYRKSFNAYFYSDEPLLSDWKVPHKTLWI